MHFIQRSLVSGSLLCLLAVPRALGAGTPISPYLIGENLWDGDTPGQGADLAWGPMKAAGFRLIRVGGIEYNDKTPSVERYSRWIDSIRSIGAEPLIQVSTIDPTSVAVDLVTSLNVKLKYKVKFWSIGNEPSCGQTADAGTIGGIASRIKERASAMKKVDPSIRIFAGDECYWRDELYNALLGGTQDITGKDPAGNSYVDVITFHSYPFPGADKNAIYTRQQVLQTGIPGLRGMIQKCATAAATANAKQSRSGTGALVCAVTEFNITYWNSSDNSPAGVGARSFLNGQFMAEIFGSGMEYGAFTVAPWSMQQSGGDGSGDDLGLFDGQGPLVPRPSYYHIKMIAQNMHGEFLPSTVAVDKAASDKNLIKAYATLDQDTAAVLVLNENADQGFRFTVDFNKAAGPSLHPVGIHISPGWEGSVTDSIPPQATLLLKIPRSAATATRQCYTMGMAQKYLSPTVSDLRVTTGIGHEPNNAAESWEVSLRHDGLFGVLREPASYEVSLIGMGGTVLTQKSGRGRSWNLPLAGFKPGTYILRLRAGGRDRNRKIVLLNPA